ncbi:MAG: replication protein [Deltaproteobacteria bacterium]|nr:replication protein [Deltaproteobacteria bacterium]MBN2845156.1 replication protein [Deltaproteobacteria bacterium]
MSGTPQLENGYMQIANEIGEAFYRLQLSGNQWRLLWVILRQTYGWKKKTDRISISSFQKKTGLDRRHIGRALKDLTKRRIIIKDDSTLIISYGLQKDYTKWQLSPKMTHGKNGNGLLPKMATELLPKMAPTKEKKEKNIYIRHHADERVLLEDGVAEVLQVYNEYREWVAKRKDLKPVTASENIAARLKDGGSVHQCCRIIALKSEDPYFIENPKLFHPATLFRKQHWQQYLDEADLYKPKEKKNGT